MSRLLGQAITALALVLAALLLAMVAIGFFAAALYLALKSEVTPVMAALICGGVFATVALILLLVAQAVTRRRQRPAPPPGLSGAMASPDVAVEWGRAIGESARTSLKGKAPHLLVAALGIGFALGVSPRLRRTLRRFLD